MKVILFSLCLGSIQAFATDIVFTNKTASFTNLQGRVYSAVELVRADLDGLIWREAGSGGRVCFTNLSVDTLERLGIPTNRIQIAAERAARKTTSDAAIRARLRSQSIADAIEKKKKRDEWEAGAPAREREAQRLAALAKIKAVEAQLEVAQQQLDVANAVTPTSAAGDPAFVESVMAQRRLINLRQLQVNEAQKQLERLKEEYVAKYGSGNH